jgi:hypothetical protein
MAGKALLEVRKLAADNASAKGHALKPWRRTHAFRYLSACKKCGARIEVRSYTNGIKHEEVVGQSYIIARDRDLYWTEVDYNWATGDALTNFCRG